MASPPFLRPQALLFDLGGVLIDISFERMFEAWARHSPLSADEIRGAFEFDMPYRRHERGEMAGADYFAHLAARLSLEGGAARAEKGWNEIFVGEFAETLALVREAAKLVPCYAFTNTNATHMAKWTGLYPQVATVFTRIFASHEIGLRKPERAGFAHVCAEMGVPPKAVLFFDDLMENVDAAAAAGLKAVLVRSPADVAGALRACGLLS